MRSAEKVVRRGFLNCSLAESGQYCFLTAVFLSVLRIDLRHWGAYRDSYSGGSSFLFVARVGYGEDDQHEDLEFGFSDRVTSWPSLFGLVSTSFFGPSLPSLTNQPLQP